MNNVRKLLIVNYRGLTDTIWKKMKDEKCIVFFYNSWTGPDRVTAVLSAILVLESSRGSPVMAFWHRSRMSSYLNPTPRLSPAIKAHNAPRRLLILSSDHKDPTSINRRTERLALTEWASFQTRDPYPQYGNIGNISCSGHGLGRQIELTTQIWAT